MSPNINCKSTGGARMDVDAPGMFNGGRKAYHFALCNDGTSNTFLLGESVPVYSSFHRYFASHTHIGSNNRPPNYQRIYTACPQSRDQRISNCFAHMGGFKSMHPGLHMCPWWIETPYRDRDTGLGKSSPQTDLWSCSSGCHESGSAKVWPRRRGADRLFDWDIRPQPARCGCDRRRGGTRNRLTSPLRSSCG